VTLTRDQERNLLLLEFTDDGPGIPAELREDVFRRPLNSTKPGGTGLGTALVKYIVDQHHGQLRWQSPARDDGRGTRVTIELPLAE
jgi:two-component system sensor histidine kinase ChvG